MITLNSDINSEILLKIKDLYEFSFPKSERKPFDLILDTNKRGFGEMFAIEDDGKFIGLAIMILYKDIALLDYFAISPAEQGRGVGSIALDMLIQQYKDKKFILEIESTLSDECDNNEMKTRIKRKNFYERAGLSAMDYLISLFGVVMEIMTYECNISFEEYHNIFTGIFPKSISDKIQKYK